jgi:hypothetical protein
VNSLCLNLVQPFRLPRTEKDGHDTL